MKTTRSIITTIFILSLLAAGIPGHASPDVPHQVIVNLKDDSIHVLDFTSGAYLRFVFYNPARQIVYQVTMPTFGSTNYVFFYFQHQVDLQPGWRVTVTDQSENWVKGLDIVQLEVTDFVQGNSSISGIAQPGAQVIGELIDDPVTINFSETADGTGNWQVDLSAYSPGYTIGDQAELFTRIDDSDGDQVAWDITIPRPGMEVSYSEDKINALNLQPYGMVNLEVYQGGGRILGPISRQNGSGDGLSLELWRFGLDLIPGMSVRMEEVATGAIKNLDIELFSGSHNPVTNVISGMAPPNREFILEIDVVGLPAYHDYVTADPSGNWEYDLEDKVLDGWYGLMYNGNGDALTPDKGETPGQSWIYADINTEEVTPVWFVPDAQVDIDIYEAGNLITPVFSDTVNTDGEGNGNLALSSSGIDLVQGMTIVVQDLYYDGTPREVTMVIDNVAVTDFNPDTNVVSGLTDPENNLQVRAYTTTGPYTQDVVAGIDGSWTTAFDSGLEINSIRAFRVQTEGHTSSFRIASDAFLRQIDQSGGTLTATASSGSDTTVAVPAGALTETMSLGFTPQERDSPEGFNFAGNSFKLSASQGGFPLETFIFQQPVTVTLEYQDEDLANLEESTLILYYWDDSAGNWIDAAETCDPVSTYYRDMDLNYVQVAICHLSQFGLLGELREYRYFPMMLRDP